MTGRGRPVAETIEEATFLLSCGESPEQVAYILGVKPQSVARTARRGGDTELALIFEALRKTWSEFA
ncbi:MAG: hypothetical protein K0S70_83 [Microbacterium sp.]|jgi:hypothetical protein|nr:hypothetical protein [Microbacterium sp.]